MHFYPFVNTLLSLNIIIIVGNLSHKRRFAVFGPILFILFIDISNFSVGRPSVSHKLFAGDLKLYSTIHFEYDRAAIQGAPGLTQCRFTNKPTLKHILTKIMN